MRLGVYISTQYTDSQGIGCLWLFNSRFGLFHRAPYPLEMAASAPTVLKPNLASFHPPRMSQPFQLLHSRLPPPRRTLTLQAGTGARNLHESGGCTKQIPPPPTPRPALLRNPCSPRYPQGFMGLLNEPPSTPLFLENCPTRYETNGCGSRAQNYPGNTTPNSHAPFTTLISHPFCSL